MHRTTLVRPQESTTRRGSVIVIAGPDGAGKSTLSSGLREAAFRSASVQHVHHRFRVLPHRDNREVDVTRPQEQQPYARWLSWAKACYLFADYHLGWQLRVRPFVRRGGCIIMERGWWDLAIDQRRYRMCSSGWLLRVLGRLLPRPDLVIVLTAPGHTLFSRKAELSLAEFDRQVEGWRTVLPASVQRVVIDATQSPADVMATAVRSVQRVRYRSAGTRRC